jgi:hypothetical protein
VPGSERLSLLLLSMAMVTFFQVVLVSDIVATRTCTRFPLT